MELSDRSSKARLVSEDSIPDHLKCSSCSKLLINCFQTFHGCRLCQHCVTNELFPEERRLCPCSNSNCRSENKIKKRLVSQATCCPDTSTRLSLAKQTVHCPNVDIGCQKQLLRRHVDSHLAKECEFEKETCNLCSEEIVHYKLSIYHKNLQSHDCCLAFSAFCPLCGDTSRKLSRADFVEHLKTCPEKQMKCKYVCDGCQAVVKRSELDEHYRCCTDMHLELTVRKLQHDGDRKDILLKEMQEKLEESLQEQRKMKEELNKVQEEQRKMHKELNKLQLEQRTSPETRCETQVEQMEVHVKWNEVQKTNNKAQQDEPVRDLLRANELKDSLLKGVQEKLNKLQIRPETLEKDRMFQRFTAIKRLQSTSADDTSANKVRRTSVPSLLPLRESGANEQICSLGLSQSRQEHRQAQHPAIDELAEMDQENQRPIPGKDFTYGFNRKGRRTSLF